MSFEGKTFLKTVKYGVIYFLATEPLEKYRQAVFESPRIIY